MGNPLEKNQISKNVSQCRKTERGDSLGFFNIHSVAKQQKIKGAPFGKKIPKKKEKLKGGTLWFRPVWYVTREKLKNLFGSVR